MSNSSTPPSIPLDRRFRRRVRRHFGVWISGYTAARFRGRSESQRQRGQAGGRHSAAGAVAGRNAARTAAGKGRRPDSRRRKLPRDRRGAPAGRRAERPAAAERRVQVPRGAGGQLGAPGQPLVARRRALAADLLGARQLQDRRRRRTRRRAAGRWRPVDESRVPAAAQGAAGVHRGDGPLGRSGGRRRRRGPGPHAPARTSCSSCSPATAAATSASSATRRSTSPTPGGRCNAIGWQHAEPVLRSLAYALLAREGAATRPKATCDADRPGRKNAELAEKIPRRLAERQARPARDARPARHDLGGDAEQLCEQVVEMLNGGVSPQSVWDALFGGAGELLMRQPGIVGMHALTSTNALRYAYGQPRRRHARAAAAARTPRS